MEVEIVAVPPPARGRRPAALRPAVAPACRTQPGRSGLQVCRAFAVRRQRIGVAHAIRAPRAPDRLRFCGPAAKIRRAARNLGDPGFGSAVFFRSGGQKSACRTRSGRPGSRICRVFTVLRPRILVPRAIRAARVSDPPRFYGPATTNRRAARNPGDPGSRSAAFLLLRRQRIGLPYASRATRVADLPRFYRPAAKDRRAARNPGDPAEASPTQGKAPLPHAASELGRPSELQYIYIYIGWSNGDIRPRQLILQRKMKML